MLSIIGIIAVIVATYQVYKTAKSTGRNAPVWALITLAAGFGLQIGLPMFFGIVLAVVWMASGSSEMEVQAAIKAPAMIIGLVCLFLSFLALWLIMRQVSKIPEEKSFVSPPSPPKFG